MAAMHVGINLSDFKSSRTILFANVLAVPVQFGGFFNRQVLFSKDQAGTLPTTDVALMEQRLPTMARPSLAKLSRAILSRLPSLNPVVAPKVVQKQQQLEPVKQIVGNQQFSFTFPATGQWWMACVCRSGCRVCGAPELR